MQHDKQDLIAFFDTESTGIPLFKERSADPRQPHLVEVASLLYTRDGVLVDEFHALIKPEGWTSEPGAFAVHGLADDFLTEHGISEKDAVGKLVSHLSRAAVRVAHNLKFDDRIVRAAMARYMSEEEAEEFKSQPGECTAVLSKPVCQLPPTDKMKKGSFKNSFKTPTLAEALSHLTGGKVQKAAHSAHCDAQTCARVYFLLKGVRMPEFPDDAQALREELPVLPHGKDECDSVQGDLIAEGAPA